MAIRLAPIRLEASAAIECDRARVAFVHVELKTRHAGGARLAFDAIKHCVGGAGAARLRGDVHGMNPAIVAHLAALRDAQTAAADQRSLALERVPTLRAEPLAPLQQR